MEKHSNNIFFIAIGVVSLIIIGVVIYLITKPKPPSNDICSLSNLTGTCPNAYTCQLGICLPTTIPQCTGNGDNCNDPTSCACPSTTSCNTSGKCTTPTIPQCTGDYNCSNNTCTCPSTTPICSNTKCTTQTIPQCTGDDYNCRNNTCTCPSTTTCNTNTGKCSTQPIPQCTGDDYTCSNNMCTCPSTTSCNTNGKCTPSIITIYSSNKHVDLDADEYINMRGGSHTNTVKGCWSLDDQDLLPLKGGTFGADSDVQSIVLPVGVEAIAYFPTGGWDNICSSDNTAMRCISGQKTSFRGLSPSGFKFSYSTICQSGDGCTTGACTCPSTTTCNNSTGQCT